MDSVVLTVASAVIPTEDPFSTEVLFWRAPQIQGWSNQQHDIEKWQVPWPNVLKFRFQQRQST